MDKKTYNNLLVSSAPHIVTNMDTTRIMMMVLIGLAPSFLVSIYVFGARVISLTLVCAVASVCFEWAWNKLMHKKQTIGDLSAVLTGVLIAFNVPSGLPYWIAIVGCFVVRQVLIVIAALRVEAGCCEFLAGCPGKLHQLFCGGHGYNRHSKE